MEKPTAYLCFMASFKDLVKKRGHGTQAKLASFLGKDRPYINDLVHERRTVSQFLQDKIAAFFGMNLEDMIRLGRNILEGEDKQSLPFSALLAEYGEHSDERELIIRSMAGKEAGLSGRSLQFIMLEANAGDLDRLAYLKGKLTDEQYYEACLGKARARKVKIQADIERIKKLGLDDYPEEEE